MQERYEAAVRALGAGVVGVLVHRNGWTMELCYDDKTQDWIASASAIVHKGEQSSEYEVSGKSSSPDVAVERCLFGLERATGG